VEAKQLQSGIRKIPQHVRSKHVQSNLNQFERS
jgi:hypothetical protein